MQQRVGIIIKTFFPQKQKIAVFDNRLGKIVCVPPHERLCLGSVILYSASERNNMYFIHQVEMIDVPFNLAHDDILFLHHVLELLYYFVPIGSGDEQLFYIIQSLYQSSTWRNTPQFKKMFLCKFFIFLGMHPEESLVSKKLLYKLTALSVDMLFQESLDLESERALDGWLMQCIRMHPQIDYFKTVHFLTENRVE